MSRSGIRRWLVALGGLSLLVPIGTAWAKPTGVTITAQMVNFKNDTGQVLVGLYNKAGEFPKQYDRAPQKGTPSIRDRKATFVFKNVPPGIWAIAAFHDENKNGKFDTNWLGIPKEGWGTSRDARARIGAPKFNDAKFTVQGGDLTFKIKMTY